jgi:SNF2 family DNA or RNA helicase
MLNRYPGKCAVCSKNVETGQGDYNTATRALRCSECAGIVQKAAPTIAVTSRGDGRFAFAPTAFLGGTLFDQYRTACQGARYDPTLRAQVSEADRALTIVGALRNAGFVVDLRPDVAAALQAKSVVIREHVAGADVRLDVTDTKLRERGLALYPFQKTGIRWLAANGSALLADEMGLGKTIQVIVAIPEDAPVLIVCPAVAKGVWAREIAKWRPDLSVSVLSGRGNFHWPKPREAVILNYDILPEDPRLERTATGTVLVADEAHHLASAKTKRTRAFRNLASLTRGMEGKVWLVTATPLLNRPPELWNILQAADLGRVAFGSWDRFVHLFDGVPGPYGGYLWGTPAPDVETLLGRVQLRRNRATVLPELPAKIWRTVEVDLDAPTQKALSAAVLFFKTSIPNVWERLMAAEDDHEFEPSTRTLLAEEIKAATQALLGQTGTNFKTLSRARTLLAKAKIPTLLALVEDFEQQDEPLVVFGAHRAPIDLLGTRPGWATLTGDTSADERTRIQDDFQDGKLRGIAATIRAGGVALTLTRAHQAVFVDREFTPALNGQAEDRIARIGQTRGVVITDIVARHPLDEALYEILARKRTLIEKSVDAASTSGETPVLPDVDLATTA